MSFILDKMILYDEYYVLPSQRDEAWGLAIKGAGTYRVAPGAHYWLLHGAGRVIDHYQLIWISEGGGKAEFAGNKKIPLTKGQAILLSPDSWHRYGPDAKTGWTEHWVSFYGDRVRRLLSSPHFSSEHFVWDEGYSQLVHDTFVSLLALVKNQPAGYQQLAASYVELLLARLSQVHVMECQGSGKLNIVSQACAYFSKHWNKDIDLPRLANELKISYSHFRKQFKRETGFSPNQYIISLRLQRAKNMLSTSAFSVNEVAHRCGFPDPYYFSRLFRKHAGTTPSQWITRQ